MGSTNWGHDDAVVFLLSLSLCLVSFWRPVSITQISRLSLDHRGKKSVGYASIHDSSEIAMTG
jgi:hypothetical protein